ncbi:choice-of-anchor G family protein [Citricoccus sp. NPDC079358]|uniref:choice-of-anchor G family protein n=1 Tax=Citricoccus sp. NPDC079358 TaxID=3154653 RepID=UPI00344D81FC
MAASSVTGGIVPTLASWNDREVAHGRLGVLDCTDPQGAFATRGAGTMVSGSALGVNLDSAAEVQDAEVLQDGDRSWTEQGAPTDSFDAYFAPLGVTALEFLSVGLGLIQLPLDTDTGVIGQYGQAQSTGEAVGASGLVNDEGVIALEPGTGEPQLATLQLFELLGSLDHDVASLVGENVADVDLEVGAVAGRAELDGCAAEFGALNEAVTREYLVSSVDTAVESPAVGDLVTGVNGVLTGLENAVNGLASNRGVLDQLTSGVSSLVGGLLGTLRLGNVGVSLTATIDLSSVRSFLAADFGDESGVLTINPGTGVVTVDTAALLAATYPGEYSQGLNGLPPNTDLLADPAVVNALTTALTQSLDDWLAEIQTLLSGALDAVQVSVDVTLSLRLLGLPIANVDAHVEGGLADLLAGSLAATTDVRLLGLLDLGLLDPLVNGLVNGLGGTVGTILDGVLRPLSALGSAVNALTTPIVTAVSNLYNVLYLDALVSLSLNNQNVPVNGSTPPPEWEGIPSGQFEVSALRLGILDAAGDARVRLHLGRGSVGPVCLLDAAAQPAGCPET